MAGAASRRLRGTPARLAAVLAAGVLAPGACGGDRPAPGDAPDGVEAPSAGEAPVPAAGEASAARPDTVTDTLLVEGMPERMRLRLVRSPEGFPLPFSAYVPVDMEAEETTRDGRPALRLVAAFGGVRNEDAFMELAAYPEGLDERAAVARAEAVAGEGAEPLDDPGYAWVERGWRWRGEEGGEAYTALLLLGRHDGRWLHVLRRYPPEYGDGFAPRAGLVLESLRWGAEAR